MMIVSISFFCFPTISKSQDDLGPVISLSFDDGNLNQYTAAWPLMKARGVVGTFYVITDFISSSSKMNWSDLIDLQKNGNEIGSHGVTHSRFTELTEVEIRDECSLSKDILESYGCVVNNFAYPYGLSNETIDEIVNEYYRSGRYGGGLMDLPVTTFHIHHNGWDWSLDQYKEVVDNAYSTKKWAVLNFHNIGGDITGGAWITAEDFAELLDYIISKGIEILTVNQALNIGKFEPEYVEIAEYYDNRKAVVTVTADDWWQSNWQKFETMNQMLTEKQIYYTGAIGTNLANWTQIQYWLNQGYAEAASHSRTHKHLDDYTQDDYDSEIGGSKADIIGNLTLPPSYSYGNKEYVYSWIEPWGDSDDMVRQKLGVHKFLADRMVGTDDDWATWDSANELFNRIGYSIRMEPNYDGVTDAAILNTKFDEVYASGQIYHLFTHPTNVNWETGEYADLHTSYISDRNDVWYVPFGHLYLYHWIDSQNIAHVSSLEDNVFQISIDSTDRENYGAKYPVTYVFDIPSSWTNPHVNYRFQIGDPWTEMETKTSSDFFNGINAVRFDLENHKAYVSIGFDDISNDIYLQINGNSPPTIDVYSPTETNLEISEGESIEFTHTSSDLDGDSLSYSWLLDTVETATTQNWTYSSSAEDIGAHNVTLVVSDGEFTDTQEWSVNVISSSSEVAYLVVRGTDDSVWYRSYDGLSWSAWGGLGGLTYDTPAVAVLDGRLHVVVNGSDGGLWWGSVDLATTTFSGWTMMSGQGTPTLTSSGDELYLVVHGTDDSVWYRSYDGLSWSAWGGLGGITYDTPAAAVLDGRLHVVVNGSDGGLWWGSVDLSDDSFSRWSGMSGQGTPTLTN